MSLKRFLKHLLTSILIGTLIYVAFLVFNYSTGKYDNGFSYTQFWVMYYQNMIFSVVLYMINAYWFQYLAIKYKQGFFTLKLFLVGCLGNIIVSLIGIFICKIILFVGIYKKSFSSFIIKQSFEDYKVSLLISIVASLIFYAIWYYKHYQENKVKEQKIIAGNAAAKFDALKNQLDPHFLFNSLNVLTSLIDENPNQAQKFTTSLSKVYRYVLEQKNKDLVTVDEELQFAKTYVRLLKMRFEDSIIFDIPDKSSNSEAKIVPLSLQLLLENAVKHNVVTTKRPLHIKVFEEGNMLSVTNNLQEKQVVKKSSGVGLTNIQQRYSILSDKKVVINKTKSNFNVELPMLTRQVSVVETQQDYINDKRYERAKERVENIKGFYMNLLSYCIVIPFLAILNYNTTDFPWAIFPALGWGFGVVAHGFQAYGYNPFLGRNWEERKMKEYMEDDNF